MLRKLKEYDPNLVRLGDQSAAVLVAPTLQARIFCQIQGELIHRLDLARLESPLPDEFNNLGGNSLWPAPEGGPFAFNYLPGSNRWVVQDGIGTAPARLVSLDQGRALIAKTVKLLNRKGTSIEFNYVRAVERIDPDADFRAGDLQAVAYTCTDSFELLGTYSPNDVLIAPWSLEQFPSNQEVVVFGLVQDPRGAINFDFYGTPQTDPIYGQDFFLIRLGAAGKFQIGVNVKHQPRLIGALDPSRSLLLIRETQPQQGVYFNIADNVQLAGPFSAADSYSIFSGGDLGFFELETIGPMQVRDGRVSPSQLSSKTSIIKGSLARLKQVLEEKYGVLI